MSVAARPRSNGTARARHPEVLVQQAQRLARDVFAARAARYDAESSFPVENYRDLHTAGLLGLTVPTRYGGLGVDAPTYVRCLLEIARGCSATGLTFNMHATVVTTLDALASPDQKRRYFAEIVRHGRLVASITSEPDGSFRDRFAFKTIFRPVPGGYRVQGLKHFCSLGDAADYYFLAGILEGATSAHTGVVTALLPRDTPGVHVEGDWDAVGMRGTNSLTIGYDCFVEQANVVGQPGDFLRVDLSRFALGYAAVYLGIAEAAFDFTVEHVGQRAQHPTVERAIAEMGTSIRVARLLLLEAAQTQMRGDRQATMLAVNQAKYLSAEVATSVTERAIRLAGGSGILKSLPLERWHRDALAGPVMPPANDRCLETVGKLLCGLPAATLEFE